MYHLFAKIYNNYMQIANPLYDTVFKYLLEDEQVAKLFLSALLARDIVELTYNPQEMLRQKADKTAERPFFSVLRLDFAAKIRMEDNTMQTVLIEVQKANNSDDIMRFRRYLGLQLQSNHNAVPNEKGILQPIPIYPIYFLGEGLPNIKKHGLVKVERVCTDGLTQEIILTKDNFVENLTFDALIVCANELKEDEKTALEKLLSIFRVAARLKYEHFLTIDESEYPKKYRPIIRRLQQATETADVRRYMDDEDDYLMQFVAVERERDAAVARAEEEREAREIAETQTQALTRTLVLIGVAQNLTAEAIAAQYQLPIETVQAVLKTL